MIQSVNFPLSQYCIRPYGSWEALSKQVKALGLDGLEVIADPDDLAADVPLSLVAGYHLTFYPDWVDFWRQDERPSCGSSAAGRRWRRSTGGGVRRS